MNNLFNRFPLAIVSTMLIFGFTQQQSFAQCPSSWSGPLPRQCLNSPAFQLTTGTPNSGQYVGPGVTGAGPYFFNPSISGAGTFSIGHISVGCTDTAFTSIIVDPTPNVTLSPNGPFCENADTVALAGGLPSAGGTRYYFGTGVNSTSGYFNPAVGTGGSPYTISYTFVSATTGCSDTATTPVIVNAFTPASISGLDTAYCSNASPSTVAVITAPAGGTLTGPGIVGTNFSIPLAGNGNHTLKYIFTNTSGCTDTAKLSVRVRPLPTVTLIIPPTQKFSCGLDGPFPITGHNPSPGFPSGWFKGTGVDTTLGTFDPDTTILGWNVIRYFYFDGVCQNSAKDSILVNPNPVVTVAAFPELCANGASISLNQGSPAGVSGVYTGPGVTGIPGNYFFDPTVAGAGNHPITYCYTGPNGCETCVTQNLLVHPKPAITFNPLPAQCENGPPIDLSGFGQPAGGYFVGTGVASDSLTYMPASLPGAGNYSLAYFYVDEKGCMDSTSQSILVDPKPNIVLTSNPATTPNPPLDSSDITVKICVGDTAFLNYAATPSSNFGLFPGLHVHNYFSSGANVGPPTDFEYEVVAQVSGTGSQCKDTGRIHINVIQLAQAKISGDSNICIFDTTTLIASGATTYQWINPTSTQASVSVSPKGTTTYQVVAISDLDGNGKQCSIDTTSSPVVVNPLPLITTSLDTSIYIGDAAELKAYGGVSYVWSAANEDELSCIECPVSIATPIYQVTAPNERVYYLTGTDSNDCVNIDSVVVQLDPKVIIFVPTAFSPNGDGYNDKLFVKSKGIRAMDFEIYDRFGKTVYSSTNMDEGWDGHVSGDLLSKDVFLYRLSAYPYKSSLPIEQAGQITLIR